MLDMSKKLITCNCGADYLRLFVLAYILDEIGCGKKDVMNNHKLPHS